MISKVFYYVTLGLLGLIALLLVVSLIPVPGNYEVMVVRSGSMRPAIKTGGIVVVRPTSNYEVGDVITFSGERGRPITHRIYDKKTKEGELYYITKGDANENPDQGGITKDKIIGKVLFDLPYLGYAVNFAKQPLGFALIILIPAIIIIADEVKKIYKELKET